MKIIYQEIDSSIEDTIACVLLPCWVKVFVRTI